MSSSTHPAVEGPGADHLLTLFVVGEPLARQVEQSVRRSACVVSKIVHQASLIVPVRASNSYHPCQSRKLVSSLLEQVTFIIPLRAGNSYHPCQSEHSLILLPLYTRHDRMCRDMYSMCLLYKWCMTGGIGGPPVQRTVADLTVGYVTKLLCIY